MTEPRTTGATVAATKKRPLWPWLLLAALIAALVLWWIIAEFTGDEDPNLDPGAETAIEETTGATEDVEGADSTDAAATTSPAVPTMAGLGVIMVGDLDVLTPNVDLTTSVGEPVEANTVQVQAVVADEAFFVGPEAGQTIMVRLQPFAGSDDPESPFEVETGDRVSFTGTLQQIDEEFLADLQLYDPAQQLEAGDSYVQATDITLAQ
ncbi:hypothetical protein SAMN05661080_02337 [Modestobacter sp. DSM 44400]|uniref:hypothetical protein n=1 Tax=Modestobacter sp. DSM 44400 TaxID=1550230 RepID=UPI00089B189F|nr:hypothetical protein [Modestobacter sp. DSM 44400]SDY10832.1 hypothetical protein SAMN05661080_02337 [Modestobacter sp. DSM 44400]